MPPAHGGGNLLHAFRRAAIRRAKIAIAENREFALRRKFMHYLLLILALPALRASAAERWEVLPPHPRRSTPSVAVKPTPTGSVSLAV